MTAPKRRWFRIFTRCWSMSNRPLTTRQFDEHVANVVSVAIAFYLVAKISEFLAMAFLPGWGSIFYILAIMALLFAGVVARRIAKSSKDARARSTH